MFKPSKADPRPSQTSPPTLQQELVDLVASGLSKAAEIAKVSKGIWPTDDNGWLLKPDGRRYNPHQGQASFHADKAIIKLLYGGRGSGKTTAGVQEMSKKIAKGEDGIILGPDMEQFKKSTWPQINEWIPIDPEITGVPQSPLVSYWSKGDRFIRFVTGSNVWYGGIKEPDSWRGPNVNWIWYDEPGVHPLRTSFLIPLGSLRVGKDVSMWLTTTPKGALHWLHRYFIELKLEDDVLDALERAGFPRDPKALMAAHHCSTYDNEKNLNPVYFAMMLATYHGKWREQELEGRFVSFEGLVYDVWRPEVHIIEPIKLEYWWDRWRVIDFGYKNPFVCGWFCRTPEGDIHLYRQLYYSRRTVNDHARTINSYSEGERFIETIADHDAEDRATLEEAGIETEPAIKPITSGIQLVYNKLAVDDERAGFYIHKNSLIEKDPMLVAEDLPTCIEEEFPRYSWPKDKQGRARKELPVDLHNHGMDIIRYLFATVYGLEDIGMSMGFNPTAGYRG